MLPHIETSFDLVAQNNINPSANSTYNMGQKDLRYLNVWSDLVATSNIAYHYGGNFIGAFSGSYNELRDKPEFPQPD